jgi:uncharacterized protein (TIGR00255 family)
MSIRSMTGFGSATIDGLNCEIRSVNHRGFDLRFRLPSGWQRLEGSLTKQMRASAERGSITLSLSSQGSQTTDFDSALIDARQAQWQAAASHLGRSDEAPMVWLLAGQEGQAPRPPNLDVVSALVEAASQAWNAERLREGAHLAEQLTALLVQMNQGLATIAEQEPAALERYAERLRSRMRGLLDEQSVDETRLLQEVALMSDRRDISEERVRLAAHLKAVAEAVSGGDAVGRRLGFLAQELLREVNTIGSKAQDLFIAERVVELKSCIEQLREQVLNLE